MEIDVYKEWLGIPEGPRPPDHYVLLRLVEFEDSADKIRNNYKKLNAHVRKYATGKYSVRSQDLLNELAKAMLCLTDAERKLDYDRSLGRVVEEARGPLGRRPLESQLVDKGTISRDQVKQARDFADKLGLDMRDALIQLKIVEADVATQALAEELGLPYVDLPDMLPEDAVLDKLSKKFVKQNSLLPLFLDDDQILIACTHPPTHELEEELRLIYEKPIRFVLATPQAINQAITKYYAPGARQEIPDPQEAKKKGGKPAKTETKTVEKAASAKAVSEMTPDELKQRRLYGIVALCWSIIVPVMIDQLVLANTLAGRKLLIPNVGLTVLFLTPIGLAFTYFKFFAKR